jgi:soluble lytic murein transglycosylase-like protein
LYTRLLLRAVIAAAIAIATPVVVHAQIYAWRDASGNLVLSDRAKDPSAKTYAVAPAAAAAIRTTRPLSKRAAQFHTLIEEHATRNTISADLVRALIQAESAFNPFARSPKGAMGLMQLMPATALEFGVLNPYDPIENVRAGVKYLKQLLTSYHGREELALAAYNAGPGAVKKYGGTVPPYRETQNYVARVRGDAASAAGLSGAPVRTQVFRTVEVVDGREIVRYTGTPRDGSKRLAMADRR